MVSSFESQEDDLFAQQVEQVTQWWKVSLSRSFLSLRRALLTLSSTQSPRFAGLVRPYSAADVVSKRGTIEIQYPSGVQGKKLYSILKTKAAKGEVSHTYGAYVCSSLVFLLQAGDEERTG